MSDAIHDLTQKLVENERNIAEMKEQHRRAISFTGGEAKTLTEALDQWENERQALAELYDENQALILSFRQYDVTMTLAANLIDILEIDAQMFITEKTRDKIAQFREHLTRLEKRRAQSREIVTEHVERRR